MSEDLQNDPIYQAMVAEQVPEFFCEVCGHYPLTPVHGHFMCTECRAITKCCEGAPQD